MGNYQYGDSAVCFRKTSTKSPDSSVCGWGAAANALQHGHTVEILNEAQAAFDALQFPGIDVILGQFVDDDDEQFTSNYFSQFVTNPYVYEDDLSSADDDDETTYTTGETSADDDDDTTYTTYTSVFESSSGASILKVSIALLVVAVALI